MNEEKDPYFLEPCPICGNKMTSDASFGATTMGCSNKDCILIGCLLDHEPFVDKIEKKWNEGKIFQENKKLRELLDTFITHANGMSKFFRFPHYKKKLLDIGEKDLVDDIEDMYDYQCYVEDELEEIDRNKEQL